MIYTESWTVATPDKRVSLTGEGAGDGSTTRTLAISITDEEGRTSHRMTVEEWLAFTSRIEKRLAAELDARSTDSA